MPLDNQHLTQDLQDFLKEIPLEEPCDDVPYQTKVSIYDEKCSGCGFALIIAYSSKESNDLRTRRVSFNDSNKAVAYARANSCDLKRTCTYPNDITICNCNEILPSLQTIVANTCRLWHIEKMNIPTDDETDFIETVVEPVALPVMEKIIV